MTEQTLCHAAHDVVPALQRALRERQWHMEG